MALTVQNLRAVGTGVEPASLLPGQICFNLTDKVLYVGDGSNFKTNFDGTQAPGVPGNGWYAMPMDFDTLGEYFVANPEYYGDIPTDQQVLTWSDALNHPIWTSGGGGGGGSQVYVVTNADVAAAPGATVSQKISAAIGVVSPDEGNVTIVTGLPDEVYEGLYFFTTEWVKGAAYAYPSASEVIYDNTAHPTLTATVQGAIDDLDRVALCEGVDHGGLLLALGHLRQDALDLVRGDGGGRGGVADEARDLGGVLDEVPHLVVEVHLDQDVAWEELAHRVEALALADLDDGLLGDLDATELRLHLELLGAQLKVGLGAVLVARVGVDDVPLLLDHLRTLYRAAPRGPRRARGRFHRARGCAERSSWGVRAQPLRPFRPPRADR